MIDRGAGRRSLNPTFVEWIMGFPIGCTACAPSETLSFRRWLRLHGGSFRGG